MRALSRTAARDVVIVGMTMTITASSFDNTNLLKNPSFEDTRVSTGDLPISWDYYSTQQISSGVCSGGRSGKRGLQLIAQKVPNAAQGFVQRVIVKPGATVELSAWVRLDPVNPLKGVAYGQLLIEWHNSEGREVSRSPSPRWDSSCSRNRWKEIKQKVQAPRDASFAVIGVHLYEGPQGAKGAVLVDDMCLVCR